MGWTWPEVQRAYSRQVRLPNCVQESASVDDPPSGFIHSIGAAAHANLLVQIVVGAPRRSAAILTKNVVVGFFFRVAKLRFLRFITGGDDVAQVHRIVIGGLFKVPQKIREARLIAANEIKLLAIG